MISYIKIFYHINRASQRHLRVIELSATDSVRTRKVLLTTVNVVQSNSFVKLSGKLACKKLLASVGSEKTCRISLSCGFSISVIGVDVGLAVGI